MSQRINLILENAYKHFYFEIFQSPVKCKDFNCGISEYNDYLLQDAARSSNDHIALTWLFIERSTEKVAAYMSLIMDAIKLSLTEKELHNLNYPFKTIPSMKIAKLAVDTNSSKKYKGIGSFMNLNRANLKLAKVPLLIDSAKRFALTCNNQLCAARFLTVDADIEHDTGLLAFYEKNGFIPNSELVKKNSKTISMRKDIYL